MLDREAFITQSGARRRLDAILVGFNEIDFGQFSQEQKRFEEISGTYSELKTNSVLLEGERHTYTRLLNRLLAQNTGHPYNLNAFRMPNLACAYLASFLSSRGFFVEIVNFFTLEKEKLVRLLAESPRSIVITTTYYVSDEPIVEIVRFVRRHNRDVNIIIGGPYIFNVCTVQSEHQQDIILRGIGADIYIFDSQGENSLAQVLGFLAHGIPADLATIPNLLYPSAPAIKRTPRRIESNSLAENPIAWDKFDRRFYVPATYMRTARSCAFHCSFCDFPAFAGPHNTTELAVIEAELRDLCKNGVRYILFTDDTFNVPLERFKELCRMLIRNQFNFQWVSFFRCSNHDEETFDLMRESGCLGVFLGIESGDQSILESMNKAAKLEKYRAGIRSLSQHKILTLASVIVGFPGETAGTVKNTIDFLQENPLTFFSAQLYYHNPMAPIESRRQEFNLVGSRYSWRHHTMDWREAAHWKEVMIKEVKAPILLPLFDFSIWSIPYFLSMGISLQSLLQFVRSAKELLVRSLADDPATDLSGELERVATTLDGVVPRQDPV